MAILLDSNGKADINNSGFSDKILSERESRKRILNYARLIGSEKDMLLLFHKYDKLMNTCTNDKERADMGRFAAAEILKVLGKGEYTVDGQLIII